MMRVVFLFFILIVSFVYSNDISPQSCDQKSEDGSILKGNFLKKDKIIAQSCDRKTHSTDEDAIQSPTDEKTLGDLKNFVNSSK